MLILVTGGSASGKSKFAEDLVVHSAVGPRVYAATMRVWDGECEQRVDRHRAMRRGKGFTTLECPAHLAETAIQQGCALLLEDLSNLTANEWFGGLGPENAFVGVLAGVEHVARRAALTVVVTNELFSDGISYDRDTAAYLSCLADLNCAIAARADQVYEVVCGIPIQWKPRGHAAHVSEGGQTPR